jgi:hypothetical protein
MPSVLFHVVESTYNPLTVTAEAAGSSPVVPAISNQALTEMASSRRRHKKVPNRHKPKCREQRPCAPRQLVPEPEWRSSASSLRGLASLLPNEKRHYGGLRSALFTGYGLSVRIQSDADR